MKDGFNIVEDYVADESFQNYVNNSNSADVKKWKEFIKKNPEKSDLIKEAESWVSMFSISSDNKVVLPTAKKATRRWAIAASIVAIISLATVFHLYEPYDPGEMLTYEAENQNVKLVLSDNSEIDLRAESSIRYMDNWYNKKKREVWLSGEAFFQVRKSSDASKPFIVHLPHGTITVLGTSFNVRAESNSTLVVLEEGSVEYSVLKETYRISPGDVLRSDSTMVSIHHDKSVRTYDSWRETKLSFKNIELRKILDVLKNSYDLDVRTSDAKLERRKITASITENDPLLLINAIAEIYGLKVSEGQNYITLK